MHICTAIHSHSAIHTNVYPKSKKGINSILILVWLSIVCFAHWLNGTIFTAITCDFSSGRSLFHLVLSRTLGYFSVGSMENVITLNRSSNELSGRNSHMYAIFFHICSSKRVHIYKKHYILYENLVNLYV